MSFATQELDTNLGGFIVADETTRGWHIDKTKLAKKRSGDKLTVYEIVSTPPEFPATVKVEVTPIQNVYKTLAIGNTPVQYMAPGAGGNTVYTEFCLTPTTTKQGQTDESPWIMPIVASLKLRIPSNSTVDDETLGNIVDILKDLLKDANGNFTVASRVSRGVTDIAEF